jgi:c-di-GMP-binding flagellar brake protein YcgR
MNGAIVERRDHPRIELASTVLYSKDILPRLTIASILDLSLGGAKIESLYGLNKGEWLEISIPMGQKTLKFRGEVRYALRPENGKVRAGVEFEELSDHDTLDLSQYLSGLMEKRA